MAKAQGEGLGEGEGNGNNGIEIEQVQAPANPAAGSSVPVPVAADGENGDGEAAASVVNDKENQKEKKEKVVFPPPATWYRSQVAAARDEMWAYCASGVICVVYPHPSVPKVKNAVATNGESDTNGDSKNERSRWPKFELMGAQLEKYNALSFCQTSWDYLPVVGAPLVSVCERGLVRVWNLDLKSTVIFHDSHVGTPVVGVDWSPADHSVIYAIDDKCNLSVWNVISNTLKSLNFGKVIPTCLKASPYDKDVVCFGTKSGTVLVIQIDPNGTNGKIIAKVRHEEEVISTAWLPKGEWGGLKFLNKSESKTKVPMFASAIHSMKLPSIRLWNMAGADCGNMQAWDVDKRTRTFKMFGNVSWAKDPNSGKLMLISSGRKGQIMAWSDGGTWDYLHMAHTHNAIFSIIQCGDILWSMSFEPAIVGYNLRSGEVECVVPTFKGCCTIAPSPVDSCRLAIGGTDSVIRVLKCIPGYPAEGEGQTKTPVFTNKLKGKVTAIAWHPTRDHYIGFGTDEGILGVFELKENNKFATTFERRVGGTVYTVAFGPSVCHEGYVRPTRESFGHEAGAAEVEQNGVEDPEKEKKESYMLYACGGNCVFMISPSRPSNPLINVGKIIEKANPRDDGGENCYRLTDKASDIRWSPDYSLFVVGYNDGRIELYSPPNLKLKCWIKCHLRSIQYLVWRPYDFIRREQEEGENTSTRWLASASNDGTIRLYNLHALFEKKAETQADSEAKEEPLVIISSEATLHGHGIRVISCAWSPHNKNLLVTVSYDCTAIIWNIEDGSHVARYMEHQHRLVACCFHPTDAFKIFSISDEQSSDFSVHVWDYREHPYRRAAPKAPGCKPAQPIKAAIETVRELAAASGQTTDHQVEVHDRGDKIHGVKAVGANTAGNRKPKPKSLLPLTANGLINSKISLTSELRYIADKTPVEIVKEKDSGEQKSLEPGPDHPSVYLGLLGNADDCSNVLELERKYHGYKNAEYSAYLSAWMSDSKWIEEAIKNREITEAMLPVAAFFSRKLYMEALKALAEKLISAQEYVQASTYFVIVGDLERAVKILVDHSLFREATALLKSNCPEGSELFSEVATKWATRAINDGNYELASKIFCSNGMYSNALAVIEKRDSPYASHAVCFLASKLNQDTKLELAGVKFILDGIVHSSYKECYDLIKDYPILEWLSTPTKIHECLTGYAKYISEVKTLKDLEMWKMVLANTIDPIRESLATKEGADLELYQKKVTASIMVQICLNETDAHLLIMKNLTLLLLGLNDTSVAISKAEEILKISKTWFEKNVGLHASFALSTVHIVTEMKYCTDEAVKDTFLSTTNQMLKAIKDSAGIKEEDSTTEAITQTSAAVVEVEDAKTD